MSYVFGVTEPGSRTGKIPQIRTLPSSLLSLRPSEMWPLYHEPASWGESCCTRVGDRGRNFFQSPKAQEHRASLVSTSHNPSSSCLRVTWGNLIIPPLSGAAGVRMITDMAAPLPLLEPVLACPVFLESGLCMHLHV